MTSTDLSNGVGGEGLAFADLGTTQSSRVYPYLTSVVEPSKMTKATLEFSTIGILSTPFFPRDDVDLRRPVRPESGFIYPRRTT